MAVRPAGDGRSVLIAGAGITGLLSAIACARAGHRVTLLDRSSIPNPACTSFDQHRAIRALDPGDTAATRRVATAHHRWLELQSLLGAEIYRQVGIVTAWPNADVSIVAAVAAEAGIQAVAVEPDRYPYLRFPRDSTGILELQAGVLLAERVLRAATRWLDRHPSVTVRPWQQVTAVTDDHVRLADDSTLDADLILIAAGPWSRELVDLPMTLYRQTMVYLQVPEELAPWWATAPSAGGIGTDGQAWLLPPGAGTLLKVSSATLCRQVDSVCDEGPDLADRLNIASVLADPDRYAVTAVRQCHYQVDADTGAGSLVRVGPKIWARAASGSDGFRTAPLIADQIAAAASSAPAGSTPSTPSLAPADGSAPKELVR